MTHWQNSLEAKALLTQAAQHIAATGDYPIAIEAALEDIRAASLTDAWVEWGNEHDQDGFAASILSVQEAVEAELECLADAHDLPAFLGFLAENPRLGAIL